MQENNLVGSRVTMAGYRHLLDHTDHPLPRVPRAQRQPFHNFPAHAQREGQAVAHPGDLRQVDTFVMYV